MRKHATLSKIAWMDWLGIERNDFVAITLDRLERQEERGAIGLKFWKELGPERPRSFRNAAARG